VERRRRQEVRSVVVKYVDARGGELPASQVSARAREAAAVRLFRAALEVVHPGWSVSVEPVSAGSRPAVQAGGNP